MERITMNTTKEYREALERYQKDNDIDTLSKALNATSVLALRSLGYLAPDAVTARKWGGLRVKKEGNNE